MSAPGGAGPTDSQLAVLLRQMQWALDEAAHDFSAGRVSPQGREELAGSLEALATIVRASAPDGQAPQEPDPGPAPAVPGKRVDLGVRPGESDSARGLGVAIALALFVVLVLVVVVIVLAGVW